MKAPRSRSLYLPIALLVGHTLLVEAATWIELDNAWNDMNPTMLVAVGLWGIDAPLIALLEQVVDRQEQTGTFYFALKVLGGAFWFAMGLLLTAVGVGISRMMAASQRTVGPAS